MLLLKRPPEPGGFAAAVQALRDAVKVEIDAGRKPEFSEKWSDYKDVLSQAQFLKCGFCELKIIAGYFGDVEHYYPKGEVWALPPEPAHWGRERRGLSTVVGRRKVVLSQTGYWWRAYDWLNYLLACKICNSSWKRSYFPVQEVPHPVPPLPTVPVTPFLINPFDGPAPAQHLRFTDIGQVEARPGSVHGRETIKTVGLDRESLRDAREEKARKTHHLVQRLASAQDPAATNQTMRDLLDLGRKQYVHAGMVRIVFTDQAGLTWTQLEQALGESDT
jgi:hypothetical protein